MSKKIEDILEVLLEQERERDLEQEVRNYGKHKLDELEIEELSAQLVEAKKRKTKLAFYIFQRDEPIQGVVSYLDPYTKKVHIYTGIGVTHKIPFMDIICVDNAE